MYKFKKMAEYIQSATKAPRIAAKTPQHTEKTLPSDFQPAAAPIILFFTTDVITSSSASN